MQCDVCNIQIQRGTINPIGCCRGNTVYGTWCCNCHLAKRTENSEWYSAYGCTSCRVRSGYCDPIDPATRTVAERLGGSALGALSEVDKRREACCCWVLLPIIGGCCFFTCPGYKLEMKVFHMNKDLQTANSSLRTINSMLTARAEDLKTANSTFATRAQNLETANSRLTARALELERANASLTERMTVLERTLDILIDKRGTGDVKV